MGESWGKRDERLAVDYPLRWHLLDTAAGAHALWDLHLPPGLRRWIADQLDLSRDEARRFVAFLAGLHDVGKACPCFQQQVRYGRADWVSHATVTAWALPDLLRDPDEVPRKPGRSTADRMGELLGGHHGWFQVPGTRKDRHRRERMTGGPEWRAERRRLVEGLRPIVGDPRLPDEITGPVAALLVGLVIVADWLVSDLAWIERMQEYAPSEPAARWKYVLRSLRDRVRRLGLTVPELTGTVSMDLLLGVTPNRLQESLEADFRPQGPGLLVITASTGYGKTEAAFLAVHRFGAVTGRWGMAVCLPTQATTNVMWGRGTGFAEAVTPSDRPVTLAHELSSFYQPYREYCTDDEAMQWLNGRHKPVLAAMSVMTIDQVLIAALTTKFNMLRLWGLLGKTLVVDEVHASDAHMLALLARLLSWCGYAGVPVILISATLPRHITRELTSAYLKGVDPRTTAGAETPEYPGWLFTSSSGQVQRPGSEVVAGIRAESRRRARIKHLRYEPGDRIARIGRYIALAEEGRGCVAVVCSTVRSAQQTFLGIRAALKNSSVSKSMWLLHARFPYAQRRRIENEVITRFGKKPTEAHPRPATGIVVTTSLLEQSLDVDFDLVISDLVPMAQLIQRLGRAWRHPRDNRPEWVPGPALVVLDPILDNFPREWTHIYERYELAATRKVLIEHGPDLVLPDDVDNLVQRVHDQSLPPVGHDEAKAHSDRYSTTLQYGARARNLTIPDPHDVGHLSALTDSRVTDVDVTTRMGIDNVWLIPQYCSEDGLLWLDPECTKPFPLRRLKGRNSATTRAITDMIEASVRCPAPWVAGWSNRYAHLWKGSPMAGAIPFSAPDSEGLELNKELGLVRKGQGGDMNKNRRDRTDEDIRDDEL